MPLAYLHRKGVEKVKDPTHIKNGKGLRMEQDHEKELQEIIGSFTCPKDFECYKSGFETLCKAEDVGMESYLACLEEHPLECKFLVGFLGDRYYCECPLRIYIAKELNK
jgi:hypothetical protein